VGNALVIARSPIFVPPAGVQANTAGTQFSPSLALSCDEGIMGNDVAFSYPCLMGADCMFGVLRQVFVIHDNAALTDISVNRCDVVPQSATNLQGLANCTPDIVIANFPGGNMTNNGASCSTPPASATEGQCVTGANFPTISVDNAGGLFAVWSEAPGAGRGNNISGNTYMYYSTSNDQGTTWSPPALLPTLGLNQNVFAWPASGDPGRIDVAFYGAPEPWATGDTLGPDSVMGHYGLYVAQNLTGSYPLNPANWTVTLASEHQIHYGTQYTLIGGQSGNRALGDFLRLRVGPNGEAEVSYADSNNFESATDLSPQGMYVRQIGGSGLYANKTIAGVAPPGGGCANDNATNDATLDANGSVSANIPHLDLLSACMTQPDSSDYLATMQVADLTTPTGSSGPGPDPTAGATTNLWQMQWHVPSSTDPQGGALFFVYMESVNGGAPTCWVGQSSQFVLPSGAELTYPGTTQITGSDCAYTATAPGTITIRVPISAVTEPGAIGSTLYSLTASTQTVTGPAEDPPAQNTQANGIVAGQPPNLIDVVPGFDLAPLAANTPEVPLAALLALVGIGAVALGAGVRRRRWS
jgi:hypothetical protein